ncbi:hypothetical protein [Priestia aryabhattai]|uniref:hypothetical protein n=1 Tax=Priestia aryabhattai TaxID=412384 RepID=UPI0015C65A6E|nr:hypothetical protein [Priestia aryabhattai]
MNIPPYQLEKLNDELTMLKPGETVSPRYLSNKTNVSKNDVIEILKELSYRSLIDVKFFIYCDNDDEDMIHAFEFSTDEELAKFIRETNAKCTQCEANLETLNIRVSFVGKSFDVEGEVND